MRLIFFDTETGGLDPAKHPITQWAGVAVEAGREIEVLDLKIQAEDHELDQAAKHINGWPGAAKWKELGAIPEANAVKQISKFIDRHKAVPMVSRAGNAYDVAQFAGFNVTFDIDFTRAMFARNMQFFSGHPRGLDVLQLACWHAVKFARDERPAEMKLEAVAIWLGVEVAGRKLHSALDDARISLENSTPKSSMLPEWLKIRVAGLRDQLCRLDQQRPPSWDGMATLRHQNQFDRLETEFWRAKAHANELEEIAPTF